ncbi:MAG: uroporphyrinogen-III synthase [Pseudomonadota bacterium]
MPGAEPFGVLITRPEPEASRWAAALEGKGYRAVVSPLLRYARVERLGAAAFSDVGSVALTSAAAAWALAEDGAPRLPTYAVGDKTAAAARAAGLGPVRSAGGDAEALVDLIAAEPHTGPLLIARGRETAVDLPALLKARGVSAEIREAVVYAAEAVPAFSEEARAALAAGEIAAIPLLSARTAETCAAALWDARLPNAAAAGLSALCLSRAIARRLRDRLGDLAIGEIEWVETPTLAALDALLEDRFPPAKRNC